MLRLLLTVVASSGLLAGCHSSGGNCDSRPYVPEATLKVPYPQSCHAGDFDAGVATDASGEDAGDGGIEDGGGPGCDLNCQTACPPPPSPETYLLQCKPLGPDGAPATDGGAELWCFYLPIPVDPVCP